MGLSQTHGQWPAPLEPGLAMAAGRYFGSACAVLASMFHATRKVIFNFSG
jgi:hypothetical protein